LVKPEGIELEIDPIELGRSMGSPKADVFEGPIVGVMMRLARQDDVRLLPIYPKRTFFQQLVLTRADSPLHSFEELRGKRVGVLNWYQHAMGVWLRGHVQETYGVRPDEITWVTDRPNAFPMPETSRVRIEIIPSGSSLVELLAQGQIDALVHEQAHAFLRQYPGVRRLLPSHRDQQVAYFRETGCFPINHVLVVRKELVTAEPWIAGSLLTAFEESKSQALGWMHRNNAMTSVASMDDLLEDEERQFGPDPFAFGLERTGPEVERLVRYLVEQELIPASLGLAEIFADAGQS